MSTDDLFPPRKIHHVNPADSVNEVLDIAAAIGWDLRAAMAPESQEAQPALGTFREFWRHCPGCQHMTRWGFTQQKGYIDGTCEECDFPETFGTWEEVLDVVDERGE